MTNQCFQIPKNPIVKVCPGRGIKCEIPFLYDGHLHFECSAHAPGNGDISGRCPTKLVNQETREASLEVRTTMLKNYN